MTRSSYRGTTQSWENKMLDLKTKPFVKLKTHVAACEALQNVLVIKASTKYITFFYRLRNLENKLYILLNFLENK